MHGVKYCTKQLFLKAIEKEKEKNKSSEMYIVAGRCVFQLMDPW
jgi:hypothetical protein